MRQKVREKERAIYLRKQGLSYNEILNRLPVAKSTLSVWLKDLPLTVEEKRYLRQRTDANITKGRIRAASENHRNRKQREQELYVEQMQVFEAHKNDPMFNLGVAFYWAEGSNKSPQFQFVNSDPVMIEFMYKWVQKYLHVAPENIGIRIYMHKVYSQSECEEYWCALLSRNRSDLKKTIFKPTGHPVRQNLSYKGCVRLEVGGIDKYHTMMAWKKCLKKHILREIDCLLLRP